MKAMTHGRDEAPSRTTALLVSRIPTWLYERLMCEAERRAVGYSGLVGAALETYLQLRDEPTMRLQAEGERGDTV